MSEVGASCISSRMPYTALVCPLKIFFASALLLLTFGCGDDDRPADDTGTDGSPTDARTDTPAVAVSIKIASWNIENLFDLRQDTSSPEDDQLSTAEFRTKLGNIGEVLREIDADVVLLQEIENEWVIDQLASEELAEMGYEYREVTDSFDIRDIGYLSRVPVTMVSSHIDEWFDGPDGERYTFTRDALEIFLDPGLPIAVMAVHFRSQLGGASGDGRRLAEATQALRIVNRRLSSGVTRMLVMGDMNDAPDSPALQAILAGDTLVDLTTAIPSADRWSFVNRGRREQLDYALGTPNLEADLASIEMLHSDAVDSASDHAPIVLQLRLQP